MILDTVVDALSGLPKTREVYYKLLGLYQSCGGCVITSEVPFYVWPGGTPYEGELGKLEAARPGQSGYATDLIDELLFLVDGLERERYNGTDLLHFESLSTHILASLDRSSAHFVPYFSRQTWVPKGAH